MHKSTKACIFYVWKWLVGRTMYRTSSFLNYSRSCVLTWDKEDPAIKRVCSGHAIMKSLQPCCRFWWSYKIHCIDSSDITIIELREKFFTFRNVIFFSLVMVVGDLLGFLPLVGFVDLVDLLVDFGESCLLIYHVRVFERMLMWRKRRWRLLCKILLLW